MTTRVKTGLIGLIFIGSLLAMFGSGLMNNWVRAQNSYIFEGGQASTGLLLL